MKLTRNQLRRLILREVRLLAEQEAAELGPRDGEEDYELMAAQNEELMGRWEGSRDEEDEAFLWLVQAGELDSEFDDVRDIEGLDFTPDGALELAVWHAHQGGRSADVPEFSPEDFRVVPVKRSGQPVLYAALKKD